MIVSMIAAVDRYGLIGDDAGLPWRLPRDLKRFKSLTLGKPIIMGRKTFVLIGRPLPGRLNIILTRDASFSATGCETARSLAEGLSVGEKHLATTGGEEVAIIGGGHVYEEAIRLWDKLYLTVVEGEYSGTAYFPIADLRRVGGRLVHEESWPPDEKNPPAHSFYVIERDRSADKPPLGGIPKATGRSSEPLDVPGLFPWGGR